MHETKVLVVGCGGIGGVVCGHLGELGVEVHGVSRNPEVVDAVARRGLRLRGEGGARDVPGRLHAEIPTTVGPFDYVLLATQPTDVEEAARVAAPHLAEDGRVVVFQNGLCEDRVAAVLEEDGRRVVGGIIAWGGQMVEPGVYDRTSAGGFTLGRTDGVTDDRLQLLATLLECMGPVRLTDNLAGARWSKLALNCAVSTLGTLNGGPLGKALRLRGARRLALELMTEAVHVARRLEVRLEKVSGTLDLDWIALGAREPATTLAAKHALLLAVGTRYRRLRSSMLRAIEAGRLPSVDYINGEVVTRARRLEIPAPVNEAAQQAVWGIARGELSPGRALVEDVYARTR